MSERTIFLAAIEIPDPVQRAAYLSQACGDDGELRAQVEALLSSHQQSSQFLETPAAASNSAAEMTLVGQSTDDEDDDPKSAALAGEAEVKRYLKPATRPGWLGRLAHYEVEHILGRGAFGIVVKAFDEKLHRVVAIKLMNPDLAATSAPRKRFLREARTAAAVRHENIVGIFAVEEEPLPYLVMEYIPGITLQQRLDQDGPLDVPEILKIGQQLAAGMAAAHAANLIHRDIKPSNILLEGGIENRAKISDFGLARAVDDASMTSSGLIAGTPMYMAPEQARGEVLDHRADLFSLGSVLYQLASGRPPFRASNTVAVLKRVCEDTPRPIQDVIAGTPDWLCSIITRLQEKDPANRFQTAKEVADLFARCQAELQLNGKVTCVQSTHLAPRVEPSTAATSSPNRSSPNPSTSQSATVQFSATPEGSSRRSETTTVKRPLLFVAGIIAVAAIVSVVMISRHYLNSMNSQLASGGRQPSKPVTEISNSESQISNPAFASTPDAPPTPDARPIVATTPSASASDPIDFAAERKAAEWALAKGGDLRLESESGQHIGLIDGKLPSDGFVIANVDLVGKSLVDEDLKTLSQCRRLRGLNLEFNDLLTDKGIAHLSSLSRLKYLSLSTFNGQLTDESAKHLNRITSLEHLLLSGHKFTDTTLSSLSNLTRLKRIDVVSEGFTDIGLKAIAGIAPQLNSIHLNSIHLNSQELRTLASISTLTELNDLGVSGNQLTASGVSVLKTLPHLESIQWVSPTTDDSLGLLNGVTSIRKLVIFSNNIGDPLISQNGYKSLLVLPRLEDLELLGVSNKEMERGSPNDSVLLQFATIPSLKRLSLRFAAESRNYSSTGIVEFRKLRPDVNLFADGREYPSTGLPFLVIQKLDETDPLPKWDLPEGSPLPVVAPIKPEEATALQQQWAEHLQRPVVEEVASPAGLGLKFALIPPGEFRKIFTRSGDPTIEPDMPVRRFRITKPYAMSTTEVTWDQFRQFVEATGYQTEAETSGGGGRDRTFQPDPKINWRTPGWEPAPNEPVTQVSPRDAEAFCAWLTEQSELSNQKSKIENRKFQYRLPTEAEWVHACRAGSVYKHVVGPEPGDLADYAWTQEFLDPNLQASPLHLVAQKKPNPFGLHDTLGNVWEYTHDCLSESLALAAYLPTKNPVGKVQQSLVGWSWQEKRIEDTGLEIGNYWARAMPNVGFRVLKQFDGEPLPGPLDRPLVLRAGQPLSVHAMVPRPEKIPGLQSWSIELAGHNGWSGSLAWSPTANIIATGGGIDGKVCLWNRDGQLQRVLLGHEGQIDSVAFSPDGQLLASSEYITNSQYSGTVRVWEVNSGACLAVIPTNSWAKQVAFSPVGNSLGVATLAGLLVVDLKTGQTINRSDVRGDELCWSPDGKSILAKQEKRLFVCKAETLETVAEIDVTDDGSSEYHNITALAWSPDGDSFAVGLLNDRYQSQIAVWDARTRQCRTRIEPSQMMITALAWTKDSQRLVSSSAGGGKTSAFVVSDIATARPLITSHVPESYCLGLSPDTTEIAICRFDRPSHSGDAPIFYSTIDGRELRAGDARGQTGGSTTGTMLTRNGKEVVATAALDIRVMDATTGQELRRSRNAFPELGYLASPSPDSSQLVATHGSHPLAIVLDAKTGIKQHELSHGQGNITRVEWSPDGKWLATGATDKLVRVWNVATGKIEHELAGHTGMIQSLAWSADGTRLASAADDKTVRVWNPLAGKLVATYDQLPEGMNTNGGAGLLHQLGWTADSRRLWIALNLNIVPLDVETGRFGPLENFTNGNFVTFLNPSPDGQRLLTREGYGWTFVRGRDAQDRRLLGQHLGVTAQWHPDSRRFLGWESGYGTVGFDVEANRRLGMLFPWLTGDHWLCLGPTGHYRGSPGVEDQIVYVAMLPDGSQRTYTPAEFAEKYGWQNDPDKATLLQLEE
jgi:serine/threonine protein kinase/WD40 repeat protein/formylglycine-generating enzyme required for sulfatase activity